MKIAHLDCSTGISGDMTVAALLDCGIDAEALQSGIQSLQLPDVELKIAPIVKRGFRSTYIRINHPEQHAHRHLADIAEIIERADAITPAQKQLATRIFEAVAHAEAHVHGTTVDKIHFHEVGAIDSIVDITAAAIGFDLLGADRITCSRIPTGRGQVNIAHGVCTIPPPATAEMLKGVPLWDVPVDGELTTPTGAAIVKTVVDSFGDLPAMAIDRVGYGAGTMDIRDRANVLRIFVGTATTSAETDRILLLETNLDDVSGEVIGHTSRKLLEAGALDAFTTPIQMKKSRPATMLSVICRPHDGERLEELIFAETATLGIRRHIVERSVRQREETHVDTPWGTVRGKRAWRSSGAVTFAPEFSDCAKVADENGVTLREVYRAAESAFAESDGGKVTGSESQGHDHGEHHHDHDGRSHDHDGHRHDHDGHRHDHDGHRHDHD